MVPEEKKQQQTALRGRQKQRQKLRAKKWKAGWLQPELTGSRCQQKQRDIPDYEREIDLPRILSVWPGELKDYSPQGTKILIARLASALRRERVRARQGHWAYNIERHKGLVVALANERQRLLVTSGFTSKTKSGS